MSGIDISKLDGRVKRLLVPVIRIAGDLEKAGDHKAANDLRALIRSRISANAENVRNNRELRELHAKRRTLREALEFYADNSCSSKEPWSIDSMDFGERARNTLSADLVEDEIPPLP